MDTDINKLDYLRFINKFVSQNKFDKNVTQDEADAICIGLYIAEKYLRNNEMINFEDL